MTIGTLGGILATFGATALAAVIGSSASITASEFYGQLAKPVWSPPGSVFGPVWTTLYAMMASSAWLIYRSGATNSKVLLSLFVAQLCLNALWSWTFFTWQSGAGSMITIGLLWFAVLVTMLTFWRVNQLAGALLIPYLLWVTFAALLNGALWRLNPSILGALHGVGRQSELPKQASARDNSRTE